MTTPESLIDRYIAAATAIDKNALLALYSPTVRIFDMSMPWQHSSLQSWSEMVDNWFGHMGTHPEAVASNVEIHATEELALITMFMGYYHDDAEGNRDGMTNRITWVAVPEGDDWRIVHEHTSVPLTMDELTPVFEP